jgi:DNA-binding NarL/FixJ family response regulator
LDEPIENKLRVLIADDHPLFRKGLRTLLGSLPDMEVAGEAQNGREAVAQAAALQPNVILMDLDMPEGGGLAAIRQIREANSEARVLVVTMYEDDESLLAALQAGARGYVLKDAGEAELARAIRAVGQGEAIFSPAIAARIAGVFAAARDKPPDVPFPELTEREREVLAFIARGQSNAAIAEALHISLKTVRNHVSNIFNKLQVADRAQAALKARDEGLE